ncbi:tRNA (adenosine(37)-N6)-threonylcarbamoyltransferase complex dimerization subunit type 1 TsaB [Kaarinaea lacus]
MKILALDTTQEYCSAALLSDGVIFYGEQSAPRSHTDLILPQVNSVLAEAGAQLKQLDAIAYGRGPGSFTGLRIAAGVAQGLALGADLPVIPVSSLAAMAQGIYRDDDSATHICAAFDARIHEVYWGCYRSEEGIMQPVVNEVVDEPGNVELPGEGLWLAIGSGWSAYPEMKERLERRLNGLIDSSVPLARDIIPIAREKFLHGEIENAVRAIPVYLRHKVAKTVVERNAANE